MARASRGIQELPLVLAKRLGLVTSAGSFLASDLQRLSIGDIDFGLRSLPCSNREFRGHPVARPAPQLLPVTSAVSPWGPQAWILGCAGSPWSHPAQPSVQTG